MTMKRKIDDIHLNQLLRESRTERSDKLESRAKVSRTGGGTTPSTLIQWIW